MIGDRKRGRPSSAPRRDPAGADAGIPDVERPLEVQDGIEGVSEIRNKRERGRLKIQRWGRKKQPPLSRIEEIMIKA